VGKEISYIWNGGSLLGRLYGWIVVSGLTLRIRIRWNSKERERGGEQRYFELIQTRTSTIERFREKRVYHALRCFILARVLYVHVGRAIWMGSLKKRRVRRSRLRVILIFIRSAFFRYVIPIGQISLWRCSVIVSLFSVIPLIGEKVTIILWRRYRITYLTSRRFLIVHILMVAVIRRRVRRHIMALHYYSLWRRQKIETGTHNELVRRYIVKDGVTWASMRRVIGWCIRKIRYLNIDPDNWLEGDSSVTPHNIKPEWYFLIPYAVLRSVPNKRRGAVGLLASVIWLRVIMGRGKVERRRKRRGIEWVNIGLYGLVGLLIRLRGTAASTEVVNLSSIFRIIGVRILIMKL